MPQKLLAATLVLATLAACGVSGTNTQSYPGRTQLQFMSSDQVTVMRYACVPGDTRGQTENRGARAHNYVDGAIRNAQARFNAQGAGLGAMLGAQAEVNAEIARISQIAEREYRCAFLGGRNTSTPFG